MTIASPDPGSFRDPRGRVFVLEDRVFRTIRAPAVEDFEFVRDSGLLDSLTAQGKLVSTTVVDNDRLGSLAGDARYVVEHERLPFVSYPYEWSFSALKKAALLHLDVQLLALDRGVSLSDATAYNVQFVGPRPVFIDLLSFRRYEDGELWLGHRQFCEQFVNPLLLRATRGVPHNSWYRGSLEGLSIVELADLLPFRQKLSWNVLTHVVLQATFQRSASRSSGKTKAAAKRKLPLHAFRSMLLGLRKWIQRLDPPGRHKSTWSDYATGHSYSPGEVEAKRSFVGAFARRAEPDVLFDIGCNTGDFSKVALDSGASYVVGFDFDQDALDGALMRADAENLPFLPLFLDAANPAPSQGWNQRERQGLLERSDADALLALALVHHLAITRNVPLDLVVDWLLGLAPTGVVEFVPKADPMVQELLRLREDIFDDYTEAQFEACLEQRARIVRKESISEGGRSLYEYEVR